MVEAYMTYPNSSSLNISFGFSKDPFGALTDKLKGKKEKRLTFSAKFNSKKGLKVLVF